MGDGLYLGGVLDGDDVEAPLRFPADRLTRHGVFIGMTGSGKTGLSIGLIEELAMRGVPIIALDPKGDLGNLALIFPKLDGPSFEPWVDGGEAKRKGISRQELAESKAGKWKKGLDGWGIGPDRLAEYRDRIALTVYTPGSEAAVPVDVMAALGQPDAAVMEDADSLRLLVGGTVAALLSLVGVEADPLTAPEHLVLARIIEEAWAAGEALDVESLILRIVDPPFTKVGVFPLDRFWKPDKRMGLAMKLNAVMASPTFAPWMKGVPLDIGAMMHVGDRVPISVFHLSHLDDAQRQFFGGLLLQRLVAWSRSQPGTSSLRGLLFLDEAFGYLPPHPKNPPTKQPLLTLMKQARAVGFGVVLATQNPVDLDYKALTNAGTWAIGRLSTKQDVERVAEGLRSASGSDLTAAIGTLKPRQFVLRDVSEDAPIRFTSRWAMSFLRGPVSRGELKDLPGLVVPAGSESGSGSDSGGRASSGSTASAPSRPAPPPKLPGSATPPPTPADVDVAWLDPRAVFSARLDGAFAPHRQASREDGNLLFRPALFAQLRLRFDEERAGFIQDEEHVRVYFPLDRGLPSEPMEVAFDEDDLLGSAPPEAVHDSLPDFLDERSEFATAKKALVDDLYRGEARGQFTCPPLKLHGRSGESREDFEARCRAAIEDRVDAELAKLSDRSEAKIRRLRERIRKKESQVEQLEGKAKGQQAQELLNGAEMLASLFFSKRKRSMGSVATRRRTTAAAKARLSSAEDDLESLEEQLADLALELEEASEEARAEAEELLDGIEEREVRLEKNDIDVVRFGVLWVPVSGRVR